MTAFSASILQVLQVQDAYKGLGYPTSTCRGMGRGPWEEERRQPQYIYNTIQERKKINLNISRRQKNHLPMMGQSPGQFFI
jgi:hypothetical protein